MLAVLLVPAAARATGHNADLSGGGSGAFGSRFWGVHGTYAKTCAKPEDPYNLSWVADVSVYHGSENGSKGILVGYMGGVRWTIMPKNKAQGTLAAVSLHALIGGAHSKSNDNLSFATGFAVDRSLDGHPSSEPGWALRFLVDYVVRPGDAHNLTRVSVQLSRRIGKEHK